MSGNDTTDPCAGEACLVPPAEFVRLRYFFGQRLGVVDLVDEQSYHVGKRRLHNLRLHGTGVLCGIRAERYVFPQGANAATPTTLMRVQRGAALDGCGREIVVGWDQCIDVAAWYLQHPQAQPAVEPGSPPPASVRLWVALCYRECPSDPAPAPRDPCGCDADGCEFARIREGFELRLLTDAEAALVSSGAPEGIPFMVEDVPEGLLADSYALLTAQLASADCPEPPANPCLLLAHFDAILDSAGAKVEDITAPDNTIPERRSLLSTGTLQQGLLHALAAAGEAGLIGSGPRLSAATFVNGGADSGTLSIGILADGANLSRDPFAAPPQLRVSVFRFKDDGDWEAAPAFTAAYLPGPPSRIELQWSGGSGLVNGARYRVLIEGDRAQPPVDTKMRPLTPHAWARHFRLESDSAGQLILADTLYP